MIIFILLGQFLPAPGTYSPEKNVDALSDTPKYSFGLKPDLNKPNNVPGIILLLFI